MTCKICKKNETELIYLGYEICERCWLLHCEEKINLKEKLGIEKNKKENNKETLLSFIKND